MTVEDLIKGQEEIKCKIRERSKDPKFDACYILDGIADIEGYINSKPRIAWILKEAWGDDGAGWDLSSQVIATQDKISISKTPSFKRVAYASRGIHTDTNWDNLPWITEDDNVVNAIKKIAWINISKIAGESKSPDKRIEEAFDNWKDIIKEQLDLYDPQVYILGNTFKWVDKFFEIDKIEPIKLDSSWAYVRRDGKVIIWAFHPSKIMTDQQYIDDIVNVLRKAREIYNIEF